MSAWMPIETAPKDGKPFLAARFVEDEEPDYEVGRYDPLTHERFVPANVQGLYRREVETLHEWRGFNNFHRMTHWHPIPAPLEKT